MTRDELLFSICPTNRVYDCRTGNKSCNCYDCECVLNDWLDDYDKHVIEQYKADTNLKDTIREIHDNVAQEMYCRGIDDLTEKSKDYFVIPHDARVIEMTAEQLKAGGKNE